MNFIRSLKYILIALYNKKYFKKNSQVKNKSIKIDNLNISVQTQGVRGKVNEPISFLIFAKDDKIFESFLKKTGWFDAEPVTFFGSLKGTLFNFLNHPYDRFQMTPYFWNGKAQDYNIQKPTAKHTIRERHHARFWKTGLKLKNLNLYVGMSSFDNGMERLIAHTIDPNLDKEREYLFNEFKKTKLIKKYTKIKTHSEKIEGNDFMGDYFFSDGKAYLLYI